MTTYPFVNVVGVDVSKATLDVAEGASGSVVTLSNSREDISARVIKRLESLDNPIVVMEASGGYEDLLVSLLHDHGVPLAVVNPRRVRDFAKGIGRDAKTDPIVTVHASETGIRANGWIV